MDITNIPAPRVEFIDKRTGLMAREWYLFFLNLFNLTGGGTNATTLVDIQQAPPSLTIDQLGLDVLNQQINTAPPPTEFAEFLMRMRDEFGSQPSLTIDDMTNIRQLIETAPPVIPETPDNTILIQPSAITVGASPFNYQNPRLYPIDIIVQGGTVSLIEFSRNNTTWYDVGPTSGMFNLSKGDRLRVTYSVTPTLTLIPR